jgi:hypothetical protein
MDWTLGKITVGLRWSRDDTGYDYIDRRLSFTKLLTEEQKQHLLDAAAQTQITKLLATGIAIHTSVVD